MAQSSVQLYGKLYPYYLSERGSGATEKGVPVSSLTATPTGVGGIPRGFGMVSGNSRLGFRGTEDLGGGLKAVVQLEGVSGVDDGSGSGGGGFRFNRNTHVGLADKRFGMLLLGNNDTIFKNYGNRISFLGVSSGTFMSTSSVLRKPGFGSSSASSFHLRRANSITYETPQIAGFTGGIQWSTNEESTATRDPRVLSMGQRPVLRGAGPRDSSRPVWRIAQRSFGAAKQRSDRLCQLQGPGDAVHSPVEHEQAAFV